MHHVHTVNSSPAGAALSAVRRGYAGIIGLSAVLNLFMLTGSLFMLQVYDRVLTSRSVPTLVALLILVTGIYICLGAIETIRLRAATRVAEWFNHEIGPATLRFALRRPLDGISPISEGKAANAMQDLDRLRTFVGSGAAIALCDLPWLPVYLAVAFLFHPDLGMLAFAGVAILVALTILGDRMAQAPARHSSAAEARRTSLLEAGTRNAEAIAGLGMHSAFSRLFNTVDSELRVAGRLAADRAALFIGLTRGIRLLLQSASLALGAYLALQNEITPGMIIAVAIITSRAMAPVEQAIGQWRNFVGARQSWLRLKVLASSANPDEARTVLPRPNASLEVTGVSVGVPGSNIALVVNLNFSLRAGSALGVIGPSGAGKSTLARSLVGIWAPLRGSIRLDGSELSHWPQEELGRHLGYLPQGIELFDGTVAGNISRLARTVDSKAVIAAARQAGAHDMIAGLPDGYDTRIGPNGLALSAGQRQRVGLARALFGSPFLLVLDEPTANLDAEGDEALRQAIETAKHNGAIVVVIAHRPSAIVACDQVLVIGKGRQTAFGPRDAILNGGQRPVRVVTS